MTDIIRQQSPGPSSEEQTQYRPDELNAELASAALVRDLVYEWPKPAIDTRKFTIIHGLMQSMNHKEPKGDDPGNVTYLDTSLLIELMDRVSEKSVNVDGKLFQNIFAYLMHPNYIIQGMPAAAQLEEEKPGVLSRIWGGITGKGQPQQNGNKQ